MPSPIIKRFESESVTKDGKIKEIEPRRIMVYVAYIGIKTKAFYKMVSMDKIKLQKEVETTLKNDDRFCLVKSAFDVEFRKKEFEEAYQDVIEESFLLANI